MWAKENYEILKNNCNGIDTYLIALSKRKVRETERFSFTYAVHLGISIDVSVLGHWDWSGQYCHWTTNLLKQSKHSLREEFAKTFIVIGNSSVSMSKIKINIIHFWGSTAAIISMAFTFENWSLQCDCAVFISGV